MNFKHILIVTYGRTGSTLLQGLLNTVDGVLVRGENFNFCHGLYSAYKSIVNTVELQGNSGQKTTSPFYGSFTFDPQIFLSDCYSLISKQLGVDLEDGVSCWGFKEIRYTATEIKNREGYDLKGFLDFLNKVLPETGVIFLGRNHDDVVNSAFWKQRKPQEAISDILKFESEAKEWMLKNKNSIWIDYSNIINLDSKIKSLYLFLGAEYNAKKAESVLGIEHSYAGKKENLASVSSSRPIINNEKKILCNVVMSPELETAFVDNDGWVTIRENDFTSIGGVVLLSNSLDVSSYNIYAIVDGREYLADWQLPSPKIAILFPDNKNSSSARFHVKNLLVGYNSDISIVLRSKA